MTWIPDTLKFLLKLGIQSPVCQAFHLSAEPWADDSP